MNSYDFPFITNGDLSLASITSGPATLWLHYGFSLQVVTTGTGTGNLAVQASNDPCTGQQTPAPTHWTQISTTAIGAASNTIINADAQYYKWIRVVYTKIGGTGTILAQATIK